MKTKFSLLGVIAITLALFFTACKKDSGAAPNYRITVTATGVESGDFISFSLAGAGGNSVGGDTWKKNGTVQSGQAGLGLGVTDFTGSTKTYVIESIKPISTLSLGVQFINYGSPMTFSYKIEKNGSTVVNEGQTLTGDNASHTKQYNY